MKDVEKNDEEIDQQGTGKPVLDFRTQGWPHPEVKEAEIGRVHKFICQIENARGHRTKRKDETIHTTTWTTHHQTPQRSTTQHSTSWRSATDATLPGHREHTGGSRQDTHGTPVLTTVRRPWVAQPHEHAHATQVTDTSCEHGWRPNSLVAEHRSM